MICIIEYSPINRLVEVVISDHCYLQAALSPLRIYMYLVSFIFFAPSTLSPLN
jgi:hypothetical protein